jgi:hypothetical protein
MSHFLHPTLRVVEREGFSFTPNPPPSSGFIGGYSYSILRISKTQGFTGDPGIAVRKEIYIVEFAFLLCRSDI